MNPTPSIWPPPPNMPPDYPSKSPKMPLSLWERWLGVASACCGVAGIIGLIIFSRCDSVRGGSVTYPQSYQPTLSEQIGPVVLIVSLCLLMAALVNGLFGWRSIGGKIGVAIVGVPSVALLVAGAITVLLPYFHFW